MLRDINESPLYRSLIEREQEKYSFYKLHELIHIVLILMNAYEFESYQALSRPTYGTAIIEAEKPTDKTKRLILDTRLMDFIDLQLEYNQNDMIQLFSFGPSESRFKLNLPENQDVNYIQDFADVLYEYRREHEIVDLPYDELDELLKKYLEISKEEIEIRKNRKSENKTIIK